jgi:hypothetical protein
VLTVRLPVMFVFAAGDRIVAAFAPGMTADDAPQRQPAPLQCSKPLDRLLCITAAGRLISAGGWKIRRNSNTIYFNQKKQYAFKDGINHKYLLWITALLQNVYANALMRLRCRIMSVSIPL